MSHITKPLLRSSKNLGLYHFYNFQLLLCHRYQAIMRPMTSLRFRTVSFARKISVVVWTSAIGLAIPALIKTDVTATEVRSGEIKTICYFTLGPQSFNRYYLSICFITFIIPSVIMVTIYVKMFIYIFCFINKNTTGDQENQVTRQLRRSSWRAAKVVFLIVFVWIVCFMPFWLQQFLGIYAPNLIPDNQRIFALSTFLLSYLNSMINPFLYTLMPKYYQCICQKK